MLKLPRAADSSWPMRDEECVLLENCVTNDKTGPSRRIMNIILCELWYKKNICNMNSFYILRLHVQYNKLALFFGEAQVCFPFAWRKEDFINWHLSGLHNILQAVSRYTQYKVQCNRYITSSSVLLLQTLDGCTFRKFLKCNLFMKHVQKLHSLGYFGRQPWWSGDCSVNV